MRVQIFTQLQAVDQQLARLARERDTLLSQFSERDALYALREERRRLTSTLKHERAHNTDLQWELDEIERRLRTLEDQERDGPNDPLVARELAVLHEHRTQLEEQVLRHFDRLAELEQELAAADQAVDRASRAWSEHEPQLQAHLDQLGHQLEALQIERNGIAQQLSAADLQLYDDLQRRHRGTALAPIRNRQCSACRARLPGAVFDLLAAPNALVRCPRCGRVLYLLKREESLND